jgi:uncharacterized protein (DUF2336 family)
MGNAFAHISEVSFGKAVNRFSGNETITTGMVKRHSLPITIAEPLATLVLEQLQDYLVSHHELSPSIAADLVLQSRERSIINVNTGSSEQDVEKLVAQRYAHKRLAPSIVLRALYMGDIVFFEA